MSQQEAHPRFVRLEATPEQQAQPKIVADDAGKALDPTRQELEERIAPKGWTANHNESQLLELEERIAPKGWTSNHNETMLDEG